jgi:hypothetical protein
MSFNLPFVYYFQRQHSNFHKIKSIFQLYIEKNQTPQIPIEILDEEGMVNIILSPLHK